MADSDVSFPFQFPVLFVLLTFKKKKYHGSAVTCFVLVVSLLHLFPWSVPPLNVLKCVYVSGGFKTVYLIFSIPPVTQLRFTALEYNVTRQFVYFRM